MSDKPKGWFSRRHQTNAAHFAAVAHYNGRRARRAAERAAAEAELEARRSQVCGRAGCDLTLRDHARHDAEPTRWHPGHEFIGPDTICGLNGCSVARQDHGIIADHPFIEPGQDPATLAANDPNRFIYLDELGRRILR